RVNSRMKQGQICRLALSPLYDGHALAVSAAPPKKQEVEDPNVLISYFKKIRPIFQANCQGCHQPAKAKGGYVMTDFKRLLAGGDSEGAAIIPEHPEKSAILKMVAPQDGEVRMPK